MALALGVLVFTGCGPKYTYPADKVPDSIEKICRTENQLRVKARVTGKTVGALLYTSAILDAKGQMSKVDNERMGKVLQAVTRVALSTELPLDYCVVVLRDRIHNNELVITRSLDDIKRSYADALGMEEAMNRTLFGQGKFETVQNDKNRFILEEVTMENFLADQIAQRIRLEFYKGAKDETEAPLLLIDGHFGKWDAKRSFRFSVMSFKAGEPAEKILAILKVSSGVLGGYKFTAYDQLEILDYINRQKLILPRQVVVDYQNKKISDKELLEKYLLESQSIQDAFKLFGFNLEQTAPADAEGPPPTAAKL